MDLHKSSNIIFILTRCKPAHARAEMGCEDNAAGKRLYGKHGVSNGCCLHWACSHEKTVIYSSSFRRGFKRQPSPWPLPRGAAQWAFGFCGSEGNECLMPITWTPCQAKLCYEAFHRVWLSKREQFLQTPKIQASVLKTVFSPNCLLKDLYLWDADRNI